jgi:Family of unknown function (DUF5681)
MLRSRKQNPFLTAPLIGAIASVARILPSRGILVTLRESTGPAQVGPPREYQFKPGQSGNPKGATRKTSLVPGLKAMFERALNEKIKLRRGARRE